MSRVIITEASGASLEERAALRSEHGVRLIEAGEEGTGIAELPDGVYGFSYSPVLSAPVFMHFRYRTFEMHRLAGGQILILGCTTRAEADALKAGEGPTKLHLFHDREGEADVLVQIPRERITHHRQYSVLNTAGIELEIAPG